MKFKRILALVLAVMLLSISFTGCGEDTTYVAEVGGEKLPVGIYIFAMLDSFAAAINNLSQSGVELTDVKDVLKQQIDGEDASQWIINETVKVVRQYIAIGKKFNEMGLSLTDDQNAQIAVSVDETWTNNGEYLEKNGISKDSVKRVIETSMMMTTLFDKFYAEGGSEAVSNDDLLKYFDENYAKVSYFGIYTADMNDEQKATAKANYEGYIQKLNEGANFAEVLAEAQKSQLTGEELENFEADLTITEEDYADVVKKGDTTYYVEEFLNAVFEADFDTWFFADVEPAYFVIKKFDVSNNPEVFEKYKAEILQTLKQPEFEEKVETWADEYNVALNEAVINKYIPKKLKLS